MNMFFISPQKYCNVGTHLKCCTETLLMKTTPHVFMEEKISILIGLKKQNKKSPLYLSDNTITFYRDPVILHFTRNLNISTGHDMFLKKGCWQFLTKESAQILVKHLED